MKKLMKHAVTGLALAAMLVPAFAGTAYADRDDHEWREHEYRAHRHWHHPPHPVIVEPAPVVYAPPVVVAPPPPEPLGINLIIPLHID